MNYETNDNARRMLIAARLLFMAVDPAEIASDFPNSAALREAFARVWAEWGDWSEINEIINAMRPDARADVEALTRQICNEIATNLPDSLAQIAMELDA